MTAIQWEDPAPVDTHSPRTVSQYAAFAEALRANPDRWALYPATLTQASATATAQQIKRGLRTIWQPAGAYEATVRTVDGTRKVYVRYTGEV